MAPDEYAVPDADTLQPGDSREVRVAGVHLLLARKPNGDYLATQPLCPHYRLPLAGASITNDHLRCPWHHSCFALDDGRCTEPPAIDGLRVYPTRLAGGTLRVTIAPSDELTEDAGRTPELVRPRLLRTDGLSGPGVTILGGGAAGYAAAQRLRELGFAGRIRMVSDDPAGLPYDRPSLSKNFLAGHPLDTELLLRPESFFRAFEIDLQQGRVDRFDASSRRATFADGQTLDCGPTLLALGACPRRLDVPGADAANVLTLRTAADAERFVRAAGGSRHVVIIGCGFVGMEAAAALRQRGLQVSVVARARLPFLKQFGEAVATLVRDTHEKQQVQFHFGAKVRQLAVRNGRATAIEFSRGDDPTSVSIDADLFLVSVGVDPATDILTGVAKTDDGGVLTDDRLRALHVQDVWAAGDIARPPHPANGKPMRIEHWRTAMQQGRRAAADLFERSRSTPASQPQSAGASQPADLQQSGPTPTRPIAPQSPPYFWTFQYDLGLDYLGYAEKWDRVEIDGDVAAGNFIARYYEQGRLAAMASAGRSEAFARLAETFPWGPS